MRLTSLGFLESKKHFKNLKEETFVRNNKNNSDLFTMVFGINLNEGLCFNSIQNSIVRVNFHSLEQIHFTLWLFVEGSEPKRLKFDKNTDVETYLSLASGKLFLSKVTKNTSGMTHELFRFDND